MTIIGSCVLVMSQIYAQTETTRDVSLKEAAESAGISLDYLADQDSLSRYDLTRLLNAVECKDCISPSPAMTEKYTDSFWSSFITIPGEDFRDILYRQWIYLGQSYYYCVASVADRNYMNGFPILTSPTCPGDFCWSRSVTKGEFFQTVINILKKYIYKNYNTDWTQISDRYTWLETGDYAKIMFTSKDLQTLSWALSSCQTKNCALSSSEQFDVYMKYCMFNLGECQMKDFGVLKAWYWPVAEMNIALHEWLIADTSVSTSIHKPIDPDYAIAVLGKLFPRIACTFDLDYDCDGVTNKRDNCPRTYNPNQANNDRDNMGDVCDDDIDGDGIMNPIGIVDARASIDSSLWTNTTDNCLFVNNKNQSDNDNDRQWDMCDMSSVSSLFINPRIVGTGSDRQIRAEATYAGDRRLLERSIAWWWNKIIASWPFIRQRVWSWWTYIITVSASHDPRIYASTQVFVTDYHPRAQALIQTTIQKDYLPVLIQSTLSTSWPWSHILRTLTWPETQDKESDLTEKTNFLIRTPWIYTLTALLREWEITTAVAEQQINVSNGATQLTQTSPPRGTIHTNTSAQFRITVNTWLVDTITTDWWDKMTQSSRSLANSHSYSNPWSYVVRNTINFVNGWSLHESQTILVTDQSTQDSRQEKTNNNGQYLILNVDPLRWVNYTPTTRWSNIFGYTDTDIQHSFFFDGVNTMTWIHDTTYTTYGILYPSLTQTLGQCQTTVNQWTFVIDDIRSLSCLEHARRGLKPTCDMDKDGRDDICDDDIDGDGVKNAIGVITHDLWWCTITTTNVDQTRYLDHFRGSCQLDNCPFTINTNQQDDNKDFIGDACTNKLPWAWWSETRQEVSDQDDDKIPDDSDKCIDIAETYNGYQDDDGCPELWTDNICNKEVLSDSLVTIGECLQCPCQYAAIPADLNAGDHIRASIWNKSGSIAQWTSSEQTVP